MEAEDPQKPSIRPYQPFHAPILFFEDTFQFYPSIYAYVFHTVLSLGCPHQKRVCTSPLRLPHAPPITVATSLLRHNQPRPIFLPDRDRPFHSHGLATFLIRTSLLTCTGASFYQSTAAFPYQCHSSTPAPFSFIIADNRGHKKCQRC
jgi:hypothetical protein